MVPECGISLQNPWVSFRGLTNRSIATLWLLPCHGSGGLQKNHSLNHYIPFSHISKKNLPVGWTWFPNPVVYQFIPRVTLVVKVPRVTNQPWVFLKGSPHRNHGRPWKRVVRIRTGDGIHININTIYIYTYVYIYIYVIYIYVIYIYMLHIYIINTH